ncbi:MAG: hypothetical protein LCI02_00595 [Proteobacteria bacterium]|nr:hypothetical protein [Pseudomonadota bacterium]
MTANTRTERIQPSRTTSAIALLGAGLLLAAPAFASADGSASTLPPALQAAVTEAVYAGGEAMPPEVERRVMAMISGQASRADVRRELAEARGAGLMPAAGELADRPELLRARVAYNQRQAQTLMARYEAEHQRLLAAQQSRAAGVTMAAAAVSPSSEPQPATQALTLPLAAPASMPGFGPAAAGAAPVAAPIDERAAAPVDDQRMSTDRLIDEATAPLPSNDHRRSPAADDQPLAKPDEIKVDEVKLDEIKPDELPAGERPLSGPVDADAAGAPVDTE